MIRRLNGTLALAEGNVLIVDVNGVGYQVTVPFNVLSDLGGDNSPIMLFTHLVVREDELSLYGFSEHDQLKAFELLISVTGVGPKVALAILSAMDVGSLAHAISVGDTRSLAKAPGLGPKTAQRLALELAGKMDTLALAAREAQAAETTGKAKRPLVQTATQFESDIVDALVGLGYNRKDADRAAATVLADYPPSERPTSAKALREALNVLTGNR